MTGDDIHPLHTLPERLPNHRGRAELMSWKPANLRRPRVSPLTFSQGRSAVLRWADATVRRTGFVLSCETHFLGATDEGGWFIAADIPGRFDHNLALRLGVAPVLGLAPDWSELPASFRSAAGGPGEALAAAMEIRLLCHEHAMLKADPHLSIDRLADFAAELGFATAAVFAKYWEGESARRLGRAKNRSRTQEAVTRRRRMCTFVLERLAEDPNSSAAHLARAIQAEKDSGSPDWKGIKLRGVLADHAKEVSAVKKLCEGAKSQGYPASAIDRLVIDLVV